MSVQSIPRVYIDITDGIATVRAVDGEVHCVLVDFDREGNDPMTDEEINVEFIGGVHTGSAEDFDKAVAEDKASMRREFGISANGKPRL